MPQGSPKSVTAVNRPVTLSTNFSRNAPTLTRQRTWTNENIRTNTAPTQSRRGHNDGSQNRGSRGGINKRKKRRKSRRKKRRKSRKSKKRRRRRTKRRRRR